MSYSAAVLAKEREGVVELGAFLRGGCALRVLRALQVFREELVARRGAFGVAREECVERLLQLRAVLADHPAELPAGSDRGARVERELREDLLPESGPGVVDDRRRDEAGVDHLQDVLGLQVVGRVADPDGRLPGLLQLGVERLDALVVGRSLPDVHLASRKVRGARRPGARPGPSPRSRRRWSRSEPKSRPPSIDPA